MDDFFSQTELTELRKQGFEIFGNRVIFDAQPPMKRSEIESIEGLCNGKLPEQLITLWSQTAGGRLDYNLTAEMHGRQEAISWCELFFNGSDTYNDLIGWIEHEKEILQEQLEDSEKNESEIALDSSGEPLIDYLPIGGFEYCDRIYVYVKEGKDYGKVVAWKQGLPPTWTLAMNEDGIAELAIDLNSSFKALSLHEDPRSPVSDYHAGQELKEYIETKIEENGFQRELAKKLLNFYSQAIADWRKPLDQKTLAEDFELARVALVHAIKSNDDDLLKQIARVNVNLEQPVDGGMPPITVAMHRNCFTAVKKLIDLGVSVPPEIFNYVYEFIPFDVTKLLIAGGAKTSAEAIAKCASLGAYDSANEIAKAHKKSVQDIKNEFNQAKEELLKSLRKDLEEHTCGRVFHTLGEDGLKERIEKLETFKLPT